MNKNHLKAFLYKVYNIIFLSEIELPELLPEEGITPDVTINIGEIPQLLNPTSHEGPLIHTSHNEFILKIKDVGAYYVSEGKKIIIQPTEFTKSKEIRIFLYGSVFGALFHQRGSFPIHGSSIVFRKEAFIITGKSAVGKSSLAAGFAEKQYKILSDDLTVISRNNNNIFIVHPGIPYFKLWRDVVDYFKISTESLLKVRPHLEKYKNPGFKYFIRDSTPLKLIIELAVKNSEGFTCKEVSGAEKFNIIKESTYRLKLVEYFDQSAEFFQYLTTLSKHISVYKIHRPSSPLQIEELVDFIEKTVINKS